MSNSVPLPNVNIGRCPRKSCTTLPPLWRAIKKKGRLKPGRKRYLLGMNPRSLRGLKPGFCQVYEQRRRLRHGPRKMNAEQQQRYYHAWLDKHPGWKQAYNRQYYQANKQRIRARDAARGPRLRYRDPESRRGAFRKWVTAHPGRMALYQRMYHQRHPERAQAKKQRRRALTKDQPFLWNLAYKNFALTWWHGCCAYCGQSVLDGLWHKLNWDHFVPLASSDGPGTVPWNLLPSCGPAPQGGAVRVFPLCNPSKGTADMPTWLLRVLTEQRERVLGRSCTTQERVSLKGKVTRKLQKILVFFAATRAFAREQGDLPHTCDSEA